MTDIELENKAIDRRNDYLLFAYTEDEANAFDVGYVAGAKENGAIWHKVADGDLPRQEGNSCFSVDVLADGRRWVYYQFTSGKWFCGNKETKITAWCEITEFKK